MSRLAGPFSTRLITPHPEVNRTLQVLLTRVQSALGDLFFGLYLYGSLATGDFDPERSDIDFVVVTSGELPDSSVAEIESLHLGLALSGSEWAEKLEGTYIPVQSLRAYRPDNPPRPTVNEGRFFLARHGSDWVIQRKVLREKALIVAGPSLRAHIAPVPAAELCLAVRKTLFEWWGPMLEDPTRLANPGYQPYAVLSICRALYTLEHGGLVSKTAAGQWAIATLGSEWAGLIDDARAWRRGDPPGSLSRTLEFIRHGLRRSEPPR